MKSPVCALLLLTFISSTMAHGMMVGGFTEAKDPTDDVVELAKLMRPSVEKTLCVKKEFCAFDHYHVLSYMSQVVAGTNYIIKIDIGQKEPIAIKVFVPLPYTEKPPELVKVVQMEPNERFGFELFGKKKHPKRVDLY
uniref:cystatin-A1-like n=1 Tax=Styela clava TaxID=7725 RepID=UPI00193ADDF6|nr:cystatin-A1-like [Styela clava]